MVEIRLHGALARDYGKVWHLEISTVQEAVEAISRARKGFKQAIMKLDRMGMVFRVRSRDHDFEGAEVSLSVGGIERIDIIPVLRGASAGLRFVIGALLVISTFLPGPQMGNPYLQAVGTSLMFGSVAEWLTPTPKKQDSGKSLQSWGYQGPTNQAEAGQVIPLIFGEVLVGSVPISAGISTARVAPNDSIDALVTIGGRTDNSFWADYTNPVTYSLVFSASPYNIADPMTYAWTVTGFALATSKVVTQNGATVTVSLTYTDPGLGLVDDTGSVSVTVTGMQTTGDPPQQIQRSANIAPRVVVQWSQN